MALDVWSELGRLAKIEDLDEQTSEGMRFLQRVFMLPDEELREVMLRLQCASALLFGLNRDDFVRRTLAADLGVGE